MVGGSGRLGSGREFRSLSSSPLVPGVFTGSDHLLVLEYDVSEACEQCMEASARSSEVGMCVMLANTLRLMMVLLSSPMMLILYFYTIVSPVQASDGSDLRPSGGSCINTVPLGDS